MWGTLIYYQYAYFQIPAENKNSFKKAIQTTFGQRDRNFVAPIKFSKNELEQLQKTWNLYRVKQKSTKLPNTILEVIRIINLFFEEKI